MNFIVKSGTEMWSPGHTNSESSIRERGGSIDARSQCCQLEDITIPKM